MVYHAIGLLLDPDSGLSGLNKLASGSGSVPSETSSYDRITRQTSFNAIVLLVEQQKETGSTTAVPMVFVSAAEAGWTWPSPVGFLERYLVAKRAVESRLQAKGDSLHPPYHFKTITHLHWEAASPVQCHSLHGGLQNRCPWCGKPVELDVLAKVNIVASENQDIRGEAHRGDDRTEQEFK